jgi:hypothetical protein
MFVTLCGFTPSCHFHQLFQSVSAIEQRQRGAFKRPQSCKLYTKAAAKANPLGKPSRMGLAFNR